MVRQRVDATGGAGSVTCGSVGHTCDCVRFLRWRGRCFEVEPPQNNCVRRCASLRTSSHGLGTWSSPDAWSCALPVAKPRNVDLGGVSRLSAAPFFTLGARAVYACCHALLRRFHSSSQSVVFPCASWGPSFVIAFFSILLFLTVFSRLDCCCRENRIRV